MVSINLLTGGNFEILNNLDKFDIIVDGILGPNTENALNKGADEFSKKLGNTDWNITQMGPDNKYGNEEFFADLQKFGSAASSGTDEFVADLNRPNPKAIAGRGMKVK